MSRYAVKLGSESSHCCFAATVVDTTTDRGICECFDEKDAKEICSALNAIDRTRRQTERQRPHLPEGRG